MKNKQQELVSSINSEFSEHVQTAVKTGATRAYAGPDPTRESRDGKEVGRYNLRSSSISPLENGRGRQHPLIAPVYFEDLRSPPLLIYLFCLVCARR